MTARALARTAWRFLTSAVGIGTCMLVPVLAFSVPAYLHRARVRQVRPAGLQATTRQAAPLIRAVERYAADHGSPPPELNRLVPRYLPRIPEPGPMAQGGWRYSVGEDARGGARWSLWISVRREYSPQFWGFRDVFAYHPTGEYPREAYGGVLEQIGRWGYYYE